MSRDIRDCSGPWKGTWVQRDMRGTMHGFRLQFTGDTVTGGGHHRSGKFSMQGGVTGDRVVITKRYWHTKVVYDGAGNGSFVAGASTIGPAWIGERGSFEMWPEDEESAFDMAEEKVEEREPVPA